MRARSGSSNQLFMLVAGLVVLIAISYGLFNAGRQSALDQQSARLARNTAAADAISQDAATSEVLSAADDIATSALENSGDAAPAEIAVATATRAPRATRTPRPKARASATAAAPPVESLIVPDQRIYALDGSIAYEGDVDLSPVLARIEAGKRDRHPNDGSTFGNREGLLPRKARNYYTEWVIRTPGLREVGPQRLITGQEGEVYYTPDHYQTFVRIR